VELSQAMIGNIESQYYTGATIHPEVAVTVAGNVLPASDYTVTYPDTQDRAYINMGTYNVRVTPSGTNLTGDPIDVQFEIIDNPTGLIENESAGMKVYTSGNMLCVVAGETSHVRVYNLLGNLKYESVAKGSLAVSLDSGIYFVKVGEKTTKVAIK